jgi:hypothetical protein
MVGVLSHAQGWRPFARTFALATAAAEFFGWIMTWLSRRILLFSMPSRS